MKGSVRFNLLFNRLTGVALLAGLLLQAGGAGAADVTGLLDYSYSRGKIEVTDKISGFRTTSQSDSYTQHYTLGVSDRLYPLLSVSAATNIELDNNRSRTDGESVSSSAESYFTSINVNQGDELLSTGLSFNRRSERPGSTISDVFGGRLSYRPADLPNVSLTASRSHNYDRDRSVLDQVSDTLNVSSSYTPVRQLSLSYSAGLERGDLRNRDTTTGTNRQSIQATFGDRFFKGRVAVDASSSYSVSTIRASSGGGEAACCRRCRSSAIPGSRHQS